MSFEISISHFVDLIIRQNRDIRFKLQAAFDCAKASEDQETEIKLKADELISLINIVDGYNDCLREVHNDCLREVEHNKEVIKDGQNKEQ